MTASGSGRYRAGGLSQAWVGCNRMPRNVRRSARQPRSPRLKAREHRGDWRERFPPAARPGGTGGGRDQRAVHSAAAGAVYCFVDAAPLMARFRGDDTRLALHLLEHGVAVVAASAFGGRNGFRISFAADEAVLEEAMRRIAGALA